jgi:hypothetical protein
MDVMSELKEAGELFKNGNLEGSMQMVEAIWNTLPQPKEEVPNAYVLIEYAVAISLKLNLLDHALQWAKFAPLFAERRPTLGEAEFLLGKVHFLRGELEESKKYFLVANTKSQGRAFIGEPPEYRRLIK